jgi:tetratricopeptide (TPR) repeat protein
LDHGEDHIVRRHERASRETSRRRKPSLLAQRTSAPASQNSQTKNTNKRTLSLILFFGVGTLLTFDPTVRSKALQLFGQGSDTLNTEIAIPAQPKDYSQSSSAQFAASENTKVPLVKPAGPADARTDVTRGSASYESIQRARLLAEKGEIQAAVSVLETFLRDNPKDVSALMELGVIAYLDLKDAEKAKRAFEAVLEIEPGHRGALNEMVMYYTDNDRTEAGISWFENKARETPSSELEYAYGRFLIQSGRQQEAIAHLSNASDLRDIRDQVLIDRAEANMSVGQMAQANRDFADAIAIQKQELNAAKTSSQDGVDFIEDRLFATRLAYARHLRNIGQVEAARKVLDELEVRSNDPAVVALREELGQQRL